MDVPLPLDKLALNLINNEPDPGNTSKYVPLLFIYYG